MMVEMILSTTTLEMHPCFSTLPGRLSPVVFCWLHSMTSTTKPSVLIDDGWSTLVLVKSGQVSRSLSDLVISVIDRSTDQSLRLAPKLESDYLLSLGDLISFLEPCDTFPIMLLVRALSAGLVSQIGKIY